MVRPYVLFALLDFLIDRNHEVFRGKGSAQELRAKVRNAVQREYPETEADVQVWDAKFERHVSKYHKIEVKVEVKVNRTPKKVPEPPNSEKC